MVVREAKHFNVIRVDDGVYAAIANEGTGAVANAGFVDLGESIVVFDSFNTQQAAAELREIITEITRKPVSHLMNSHWHGDHIRGNQVFQDVTIIASEQTKRTMQERHPDRIALQRSRLPELAATIVELEKQRDSIADKQQRVALVQQISFLKDIETSLATLNLVLPNLTFQTEWSISSMKRQVQCRALGKGHTTSDSVLYVPEQKVCYVGDLVAVKTNMLIVDGDISSWLQILDVLNQWDIEYLIPGHGLVAGREWITHAATYLKDLIAGADTLYQQGRKPEEISDADVPEKYRDWAASGVYVHNLKHLVDSYSKDIK